MLFRTGNHKVYGALKKHLEENKIDFRIECIPCGMAVFHIKPKPEQVYYLNMEVVNIQKKVYGLV